jgi:hypothetical protein
MSENKPDMSKSNLARLCGVSKNTVGYWCNVLYLVELQKLGYNKNQKVLTPAQWNFMYKKLDC